MTPHDSASHDKSRDDASPRVHSDVSDLLRQAASEDSSRMPADVAARIRAQMASEFGTTFTEPATSQPRAPQTPIIVPLPVRRESALTQPEATPSPPSTGASVHSFDDARTRRAGRRRNVWAASAAAAAVVVAGGVGINVMENGPTSSVAGHPTQRVSSSAAINIRNVRITQTNTEYDPANLALQINRNKNATAPVSPSLSNDTMTTEQGVNSCLTAILQMATAPPKSVHADFGTYKNKLAVIVTLDYGTKKTVWIVKRGCVPDSSSVLDGPFNIPA